MAQKGKAKAAPAAKKSTAAKAPKTTKATGSKKMIQTTLKSKPASKKRPKPDSDDDDEDPPSDVDPFGDGTGLSNTPPSFKKQKKVTAKKGGSDPLRDIENESMALDDPPQKTSSKNKKNATDRYQKLTQLEHIIKRPDTYIGSVEMTTEQMWGK